MTAPKQPVRYVALRSHRQFTTELVQPILMFLADGSAPFLSLAAERAGFSRNTVKDWVRLGEIPDAQEDLAEFAQQVRRIRADWCANMTKQIMAAGGDREANRAKTWLLERVERDLCDLTRVHQPKDRNKSRPMPEPGEITEKSEHEVLDELSKPEVHVLQ